jgi:hypothetical protein
MHFLPAAGSAEVRLAASIPAPEFVRHLADGPHLIGTRSLSADA